MVVIDCSFDLANPAAGRDAYHASHVPGAFYMHLDNELSGPKTGTNGRHPLPDAEALIARLQALGEYGGWGLAVPGHTWVEDAWGYNSVPDEAALTAAYVESWRKVWQFKDTDGLGAAVYTQTTDVEAECNGLLTYDRAVVKMSSQQAVDAVQGRF